MTGKNVRHRNYIKDKDDLMEDIERWKNSLINTMGVIGLQIEQYNRFIKVYKLCNTYCNVYRIRKDVYFFIVTDISAGRFDDLCDLLKDKCHKTTIYCVFQDDEPDPQQMILHVMKQLQVNRNRECSDSLSSLLYDIQHGYYQMYLQPKMDIRTNTVVGAEALVRYCRDGKVLPPSKFISTFEDKGLIFHIDLFIFEEVCKQLKVWQQEGRTLYPISLNFSRITLLNDHLIQKMNEIQQKYRISRKWIEIEITESVGEIDRKLLKQLGMKISDHGYRLSLDDFGVRYSNIALLSLLPFHSLKLDRSIVQEMSDNTKLQVMIENLIQLCKKLDIVFIAEGIETMAQKDMLKRLGCTIIQGFLVNKPLMITDYEKIYLRNKKEPCNNVNLSNKQMALISDTLK